MSSDQGVPAETALPACVFAICLEQDMSVEDRAGYAAPDVEIVPLKGDVMSGQDSFIQFMSGETESPTFKDSHPNIISPTQHAPLPSLPSLQTLVSDALIKRWNEDWDVLDIQDGGLVYGRTGKTKSRLPTMLAPLVRQCVVVVDDKVTQIRYEKV
eukprot:CAMPEP_0118855110 /NCGR_PEP_ID=MMETSP1163-20130328/3064_1 /TAXON_ID=124430 /ORGANISM="Phaeomonas parva, Strain CCMP2877" /LENGTH=155 /DNA_ID=CAMNT_0006787943 /DNA_START=186 /DNA_END=654 /DNA_ORIENTATION=+